MLRKFFVAGVCILSACSTLNQSLLLGAGMGGLAGAAATYAGHSGAGFKPTLEEI